MIKQPLANLPIVSFQPVPFSDFPQLAPEVLQDLSWDQNYLMRMCIAVMDAMSAKSHLIDRGFLEQGTEVKLEVLEQ